MHGMRRKEQGEEMSRLACEGRNRGDVMFCMECKECSRMRICHAWRAKDGKG